MEWRRRHEQCGETETESRKKDTHMRRANSDNDDDNDNKNHTHIMIVDRKGFVVSVSICIDSVICGKILICARLVRSGPLAVSDLVRLVQLGTGLAAISRRSCTRLHGEIHILDNGQNSRAVPCVSQIHIDERIQFNRHWRFIHEQLGHSLSIQEP